MRVLRSSIKMRNDRIVVVEQAIVKLEALTNEKIGNINKEMAEIKSDIKNLKENEILHLGEEIGKLKEEIVKLRIWQAKVMGAIGLVWILIQVALKIWK